MIALALSLVVSSFFLAAPIGPQNAANDPPAKSGATPAPVASATLPADATAITDAQVAEFIARIHAGESAVVVRELENHPLIKKNWDRRAEIVLGTALYFSGRYREANLLATKHKAATARDPNQLKFVGYAFLGIEDFTTAEKYFRLAQHWAPDDFEAKFNETRARALAQPNHTTLTAVMAFESRAKELPKDQFDEVVADLAVRIAHDDIKRGTVGDPTLALLKDAVSRRPTAVEPPELLASIYIERGDYDAAKPVLADMEREFDDQLWRVIFLQGRSLERRGMTEQAMTHVQAAVTLSEWKHLPSLLLVARTAMKLGRLDDARRPLDSAMIVAPNDYDALTLFARYLLVRAKEAPDADARREFMSQCENRCIRAMQQRSVDSTVYEIQRDLYTLWGKPKEEQLTEALSNLARTTALRNASPASTGATSTNGSPEKPR